MRTLGIVLFGLLLSIQCRADDKPADAKQTERLKQILDKWEKATKSVREMHYRFTQTENDRVFQTKKVRTGQVFIKMPELVRVDLTEPDGKTIYLLFKDRTFHFFHPYQKTEMVIPVSKEFGFPEHPDKYPRDRWFEKCGGEFLESLAMIYVRSPLREMQTDGDLRLTKEDANWIYLEWQPRKERFRTLYRRFLVVLDARTYQVRTLWWESPSSTSVRLDIEKLRTNPQPAITGESILKGLPQDYKQENLADTLRKFGINTK